VSATTEPATIEPAAAAPVAFEPEHIDPLVYRRRWAILTVLCTSLMIVIIGNTALNVAIPRLAEDLDASTSRLQWMVDAYGLVFAGMLFTAGAIGDRFGRKGTLQAGLGLFLVGTTIAAFGGSSTTVIAARATMGLAAAFIMPSTLSILANVFPAEERARAIGVWAGIAGGGGAIGPIASGFLLDHFWWGSVFLVNIPVIVGAFIAGRILLPTSRDPEETPLDLPGAGLSILGLVLLVYGIIEGPAHGWLSADSLAVFLLAAVVLALFGWRELHTDHPMLDLRLFRDRRFSVASGGMTLVFFAMYGTFFLVSQYFQLVHSYTPFESGLFQLPMAVVMMTMAPQAPRLVARYGAHKVVSTGLGLVGLGLLVFAQLGVSTPIWFMYPSILLLGLGMSITMAPLTAQIMSAVSLGKAGVGSAMNDTTRELGGALGVAILGSLVTSQYTAAVDQHLAGVSGASRSLAESGLSGAFQVAHDLGAAGNDLVLGAKEAFMDGVHLAAICGAVVVWIAAVLARRLLPQTVEEMVEQGLADDELVVDGEVFEEVVLEPV
jgi:EmrB/QacA subfamily drug resistance transporter